MKYFTPSQLTSLDNQYETIKIDLFTKDIRSQADGKTNAVIRQEHSEYLKKYIFNFPDKRNFHVIRYFTHTTKGTCIRLFPLCGCGEIKTPSHSANECSKILKDKNRKKVVDEIEAIFRKHNQEIKNNLYDYLHAIFYTINDIEGKDRNRLTEILKNTIYQLIVNDESKYNANSGNLEIITEEDSESDESAYSSVREDSEESKESEAIK